MPTPIGSILHRAKRKPGDALNVLTFNTHERVQGMMMGLLPHQFYCLGGPGIKDWNPNYGPVPLNHTILDKTKGEFQIPNDVEIDCVLSQSRHAHFGMAKHFSSKLQVPLITYEHCIPHPSWPKKHIESLKSSIGDINVYITDFSIKAWGFEPSEKHLAIYHYVDTDYFASTEGIKITPVLTVCNDMPGRPNEVGWQLWQEINGLSQVKPKLVGDNRGWSEAPKTLEELKAEYQSAKLFLNTTISSTIPTSMLEAMACGAIPISTKTGAIPEIIKHGVNGLLYENPKQAVEFIQQILSNPPLMKFLAKNARKTVVEKFTKEAYVTKWNMVFDKVISL